MRIMKPTILKKIVNSLNLNRYYKDEFYKFLLGNNSGNSEKIICTIDYDFYGTISKEDLNKYFNNLSFINHNLLEPIELQLKVRHQHRNDLYDLLNCISCEITYGNANDETPIRIQDYYFVSAAINTNKYCISISYRESDNSFYDAYIDNERFNVD